MANGISLIVPCYNHGATLERAVRSALTHNFLEIVVVDDCSTDNSFAVAEKLAAADSRIRAIRAGVNGGPGVARNLGASITVGPYLSFLDADDEIVEDYCTEALAIFAASPEIRAIKTDELFFDPVKGFILPPSDPRYKSAVLSSVPGLVIDREVFFRMGGFPENPAFRGPHGGEDVAFMQALMAHFQPLGRIGRACYKVWSQEGSHVDRFLASTRLSGETFEFVVTTPDQQPGGVLDRALREYLATVAQHLGPR